MDIPHPPLLHQLYPFPHHDLYPPCQSHLLVAVPWNIIPTWAEQTFLSSLDVAVVSNQQSFVVAAQDIDYLAVAAVAVVFPFLLLFHHLLPWAYP